jgi:hypothetical protein
LIWPTFKSSNMLKPLGSESRSWRRAWSGHWSEEVRLARMSLSSRRIPVLRFEEDRKESPSRPGDKLRVQTESKNSFELGSASLRLGGSAEARFGCRDLTSTLPRSSEVSGM